jgi:hypothetical protein
MAHLLWSLESSGILQMNPEPAWIFALLSRSNKTARRRGRLPWVGLSNSGFGTVFGVVDGKPQPVCDYAGFARARYQERAGRPFRQAGAA